MVDNRDPNIVPHNTDPVAFVERAVNLLEERQTGQAASAIRHAPATA